MRDDIMLVMAHRDGQDVAGALNFIGRDVIYGRYWGCIEDHPCLHFEACYYQAIEYAIRHGLARVEAGAQGEHKIQRGFRPVKTYSNHWIADPGFSQAIADFTVEERAHIEQYLQQTTAQLPFKTKL
jgi:predicted N-acyltransferase